jgi:hypothetical protein
MRRNKNFPSLMALKLTACYRFGYVPEMYQKRDGKQTDFIGTVNESPTLQGQAP